MRSANIIGSGPNGLAAAITLAERGVAVTVYERNAWAGGGVATGEVTLPGFRHDLGSSVYPFGVASPFFRTLPLAGHGLQWIEPDAAMAHPLDDGSAVLLEHSLEATAAQFGEHDARAWKLLLGPAVREWESLVDGIMRPLGAIPRAPMTMASFGSAAMMPAHGLAKAVFQSERERALFAGCAAHSVIPLTNLASSAAGLALAAAGHATGWPIIAGGAQSLTNALVSCLETLGGRVVLNAEVKDLRELPQADVTMFDTSVESLIRIAGNALTPNFVTRLRHFPHGPGIFKVDWALSQPIPWRACECARAATVHLGGTLDEITASEAAAFNGRHCDKPFTLLVQPSLFDPTRAPAGKHTAWAYCHVPSGSNADRTEIIEQQVEHFAPGFRNCILARKSWNASALESWNPNLAAGDISGGAMTLGSLIARPTLRHYRTSNDSIFLCSSSTPPGGGVHGMCGHLGALAALGAKG
jgi:phytoene dehydrogenase-like protein